MLYIPDKSFDLNGPALLLKTVLNLNIIVVQDRTVIIPVLCSLDRVNAYDPVLIVELHVHKISKKKKIVICADPELRIK